MFRFKPRFSVPKTGRPAHQASQEYIKMEVDRYLKDQINVEVLFAEIIQDPVARQSALDNALRRVFSQELKDFSERSCDDESDQPASPIWGMIKEK